MVITCIQTMEKYEQLFDIKLKFSMLYELFGLDF